MAAVRIARAVTGREHVLAIAGAYHGHHDTALAGRGSAAGIPRSTVELVHTVPFNDAGEMERSLSVHTPACVLMEAATTHRGVVAPHPGYLETVRELTRRHGVVLILDEVKTGLTIAAGGAVERFGVEPDLVSLAKALGGGLPSGAIGMSEEVARLVEDGRVPVFGTYNGNPLGMAAARANLLEVLIAAAYERLERLGERLAQRLPLAPPDPVPGCRVGPPPPTRPRRSPDVPSGARRGQRARRRRAAAPHPRTVLRRPPAPHGSARLARAARCQACGPRPKPHRRGHAGGGGRSRRRASRVPLREGIGR